MKRLALLWLLAGCADNGSGDNCACTISIDGDDAGTVDGKLVLGCGEQGCLAGRSYGCDNDNVLQLGICNIDMAAQPVRDDMGTPVCYPLHASCVASLPCCGADAGLAATCDPVTDQCCVPTGSPCTTSGECCSGKACVTLDGQDVCGS